ncbi:hypothetical protein BB934_23730 [Microvirga ossetica]|uniref:Uncharacterized protein n=1 Tax=Microvirga ossetica TaxID=1882682 RepID=A0A1B2ELQ0_9HYPH|nr:hypothetical protein BB934_23730 [Microvirga ossetica]
MSGEHLRRERFVRHGGLMVSSGVPDCFEVLRVDMAIALAELGCIEPYPLRAGDGGMLRLCSHASSHAWSVFHLMFPVVHATVKLKI